MALRNQQIPSPNGRQAEAAGPSTVRSSERRSATPVESAASRELRKLSVVKKATGAYNDMREKSSFLRSVTDKIEEHSKALCRKVIGTQNGSKADKMLAHIARRAKGGKIVNFSDEEMDGPFNDLGRYGVHAAFRYWPPTLLLRWGVDASLFASSATLAFMKDICCTDTMSVTEEPQRADIEVVFSQFVVGENGQGSADDDDGKRTTKEEDEADNGSPSKKKPKGDSPSRKKSKEGSPSKNKPEDDSAERSLDNGSPSKKKATEEEGESSNLRVNNVEDLQEDSFAGNETGNFEDFENVFENTYVGWIMNGLEAVLNTTMRFFCGLVMPFVTIMTLLLYRSSNKLHEWAGISQYEAPRERKDRETLFARLLRFEEIEKIIQEDNSETCKTSEWLFDVVVDRQVGCLRKYFVFKPLLDVFDVYHPVKIAEKTAAKISEIKRTKTASLVKYLQEDPDVKYLQEDPDYNEETDPDYKLPADEASDDSLEYKEDEEMDPETGDETDNDVYVRNVSSQEARNDIDTLSISSTPTEVAATTKGMPTKQLLSEIGKSILPPEIMQPISPIVSPLNVTRKSRTTIVKQALVDADRRSSGSKNERILDDLTTEAAENEKSESEREIANSEDGNTTSERDDGAMGQSKISSDNSTGIISNDLDSVDATKIPSVVETVNDTDTDTKCCFVEVPRIEEETRETAENAETNRDICNTSNNGGFDESNNRPIRISCNENEQNGMIVEKIPVVTYDKDDAQIWEAIAKVAEKDENNVQVDEAIAKVDEKDKNDVVQVDEAIAKVDEKDDDDVQVNGAIAKVDEKDDNDVKVDGAIAKVDEKDENDVQVDEAIAKVDEKDDDDVQVDDAIAKVDEKDANDVQVDEAIAQVDEKDENDVQVDEAIPQVDEKDDDDNDVVDNPFKSAEQVDSVDWSNADKNKKTACQFLLQDSLTAVDVGENDEHHQAIRRDQQLQQQPSSNVDTGQPTEG